MDRVSFRAKVKKQKWSLFYFFVTKFFPAEIFTELFLFITIMKNKNPREIQKKN